MDELKESDFAAKIGVSRRDIKNLRDSFLRERIHFYRAGKSIVYTAAGQIAVGKKIASMSNFTPAEILDEEKKESPAKTPEKTSAPKFSTATVERVTPNKMILICSIDGVPNRRVRVRDNSKFVVGMTFQVSPMRDAGLWTIVGNCPRWKGKF